MISTMRARPDTMEQAFSALDFEDRAEIVSLGAAFHRLTLRKRLERAGHKVREFEVKYQTTLDRLETYGLPDDADYAMHEDYVEWHYWSGVLGQTSKTLMALDILTPEVVPA